MGSDIPKAFQVIPKRRSKIRMVMESDFVRIPMGIGLVAARIVK